MKTNLMPIVSTTIPITGYPDLISEVGTTNIYMIKNGNYLTSNIWLQAANQATDFDTSGY